MTDGDLRKITLENGLLYSQLGNRSKLSLFPESETRFFYGFNPDITIEFLKNEKKEVTNLRIFQAGEYATSNKTKIP